MSENKEQTETAVAADKAPEAATETPKTDAPKTEDAAAKDATAKTPAGADTQASERKPFARGGARQGGSFGKKPFRKSSRFRSERPKPEFDQKIINISRVTRVVKGGRRLSFRVDMVIGDKKGRIGLGSGKATDTSLAIQKAFTQARKNLIKVKLTQNKSIEYPVSAKVTSSRIEMMPNSGRGLVAGSTVRTVLELAGVTDVSAKVYSRSKNKLNNAKAAIKALTTFSIPLPKVSEVKKDDKKGRFNRDRRSTGRRTFNNK